MQLTNEAAWLDGVGQHLRVGPADIGKPGPGEVLIKTHAIALNPIDFARQQFGILVEHWPTVLGSDVAGEVVDVGEGITDVSKGQRVIAQALGIRTGKPENGSFQTYVVVLGRATCPIPDRLSFEEASVIPLGLSTAAFGLYQEGYLGLPFPTRDPKKIGKTIIVWGGSSSVGSSAIQLAVASGLDVVTTASTRNSEFCRSLGAKKVFDHHNPAVVEDLVAALQNDNVIGAYDGEYRDHILGLYSYVLAIGLSDTTAILAHVLEGFGGGMIASVRTYS
jgi:NADPH:quinone reductase-like Zn-dependent oxidoreductase